MSILLLTTNNILTDRNFFKTDSLFRVKKYWNQQFLVGLNLSKKTENKTENINRY